MAYRILHAVKRFAVQAAVRLLPVEQLAPETPRARVRHVPGDMDVSLDALLFDGPASSVNAMSSRLGDELSRVSGKLEAIRGLLSDLARVEPVQTFELNAVGPANYRWSEDILFDGGADVVLADPVLSVTDDAAFLFEDEEPSFTSWHVLRPSPFAGGGLHAV